jgi:multidrug efflux system membrane fusion protein
LCILAALPAGCSKKTGPAEAGKGGPRALPVVVETIKTRTVPIELATFGTVEPSATVSVRAEVTGILTQVDVKKGQDVKKGELLFTIDPRPFQSALAQARANLARDKAQAAHAKRSAARDAELFKGGLMPENEFEKSQSEAEATAAVVLADEAVVDNAQLQVDRCFIRSPLDGRAGNILVDGGNLVKANDTVLLTIHRVRPVEVFFSIPQRELPTVQRYAAAGALQVRAGPPKDPAPMETGRLIFIDNAVDKATGTIQLAGVFENAAGRLWPGQYVDARLTLTQQQDAVVAPAAAVQAGRDGKYVFVVRDDLTAQVRPVVTRESSANEVVIESGLTPGDRVVTRGQLRLTPGAKVEIIDPAKPPASKEAGGKKGGEEKKGGGDKKPAEGKAEAGGAERGRDRK